MKKVIHFVLIQFLVTVVFSQDYGTGDNTTDADLKKLLKAAARSRGDRIDLPDSFSIKQYAPQPQNQGKLETCVGWSTAYAARTISYMIKKNLTHPDSIKKYAFSPGYIYYKIKDPADKNCTIGSKIQDAMAVMKSTGAILKKDGLEDCMINFSKKLEQKKASPYLIKDYQLRNENIGSFSENDILDLKKSLTEKKPVVISLKIDNSFNKVSANSIWSPSSVGRGHAMCIVGYNDSIGNGGSFEVMNSYGTSWGNQGFFWLSYKQLISYGRYALELMDAEAPTTRGNGFKNLEIAGKIEFLKIRGRCADGEKIVISVTGPKINTNGIITGNNKASEFNLYRLNDTLQNDTRFQIRFSASTQSYIYIFSQDDKNIISEYFPPENSTISAAINSPNTNYYLPDEYSCGQLSSPGKENICILYSKSEINLKDLIQIIKVKKSNILEVVKFKLGKRLIDVRKVDFNEKEIIFRAPADENSVLCFFVEMVHN